MEDEGRIDGAAASSSDDSFQRSQTHRGVDASSLLDMADRSSTSQVADDDIELLLFRLEMLCERAKDRSVRETMEAVLKSERTIESAIGRDGKKTRLEEVAHLSQRNRSLLGLLQLRNGVSVDLLRESLMEHGVEEEDGSAGEERDEETR